MLVWYFYHNEWTNTDKYYASKTVFYLDFHSSTYHSFPTPGSHLGHYIAIITLDIYSVLFSLILLELPLHVCCTYWNCFMALWYYILLVYFLFHEFQTVSFLRLWTSDCEPIVVILQFCCFFPLEFFVLYSWVLRFSVCVYYSLDFVCYAICLLK